MNRINRPDDLQNLSEKELELLCSEIREKIIHTVANNGGHLASNLGGVVELTVALHRVFRAPQDKIVWDVGHQAYTHKILTGRREQLDTIRTRGRAMWLSKTGRESPYDPLMQGMQVRPFQQRTDGCGKKKIRHEPGHVVAVIGDGSLDRRDGL